ncbi:vomeronasal type-1 receptor 4-like [Loxodonta africana]|uniref:vomeronasal type-1 receptor 4-like n=1 Tax=Loxodonta africana TaxID=9785 RepID=UPI000C810C72|nr:vomeronasal type-1 receptor 4-like [Loxodonta africana]
MIHVAHSSCSHTGLSDSEDKYQSLRTIRMDVRELAIGTAFLSQTIVGTLGNFSLLYHYVFLYFMGCRFRPTDLILMHLFVANSIVVLSRGIPQTMVSFRWKVFFNDIACKLFAYTSKVGRGVSLASTCLLSIFQATTISPRNSRWAELRGISPKYIGPSISMCWILQMLVNIIFPVFVISKWSNTNITSRKDLGYCSSVRHVKTVDSLYAALLFVPDVVCLAFVIWASGSMVFTLYRHKKQVQHVHRNNISSRSSPESRATKTILLLVSTFAYFYTFSAIFHCYLALAETPSWWLENASALIHACFPTVSPFVLMSHVSSVSRLCFAWRR